MQRSVFCIAPTPVMARTIVANLRAAGFVDSNISVLYPDRAGTREFALEEGTKAPEGAAAGASAGAVVGGALGVLAGLGALAIPGIGPFIAAGPILAGLSAMAVGAAVGGIAGGLVGLGIPEVQAKVYANKVSEGNILMSAHAETPEQVTVATDIFTNAGAYDIFAIPERAGRASNRPM
jgi:hypothetical protein